MSGPDRNASDDPKADLESMRERIAQELAALGEDPLEGSSEDDLALGFALAQGSPHADIDVATVQTLAGWAQAPAPEPESASEQDDALSELAQARVWRTVELRSKNGNSGKADGITPQASPAPSSRPLLIGTVVALLAVAAGVILVPVLTADTPEPAKDSTVAQAPASITTEELDVLSTQARAGLAALDRLSGEPTGTARVEALASDYAIRLEALAKPSGSSSGHSPGHRVGPRGNPRGGQG